MRLTCGLLSLDQIAQQVEDPGLKHSSPTLVGLELSTRHAAEFFGFYICRFVLNDVGLMLDKFIKRGSEWVLTWMVVNCFLSLVYPFLVNRFLSSPFLTFFVPSRSRFPNLFFSNMLGVLRYHFFFLYITSWSWWESCPILIFHHVQKCLCLFSRLCLFVSFCVLYLINYCLSWAVHSLDFFDAQIFMCKDLCRPCQLEQTFQFLERTNARLQPARLVNAGF